jgi:hypothetical protein
MIATSHTDVPRPHWKARNITTSSIGEVSLSYGDGGNILYLTFEEARDLIAELMPLIPFDPEVPSIQQRMQENADLKEHADEMMMFTSAHEDGE